MQKVQKSRIAKVEPVEGTNGRLVLVKLKDGQSFFMRDGRILPPMQRIK